MYSGLPDLLLPTLVPTGPLPETTPKVAVRFPITLRIGLPSGLGTQQNPIPVPGVTVRPTSSSSSMLPVLVGVGLVAAVLWSRR